MNQIMLGDTFEILPTLTDNSVDLVVFSPPYDAIRDYSGFPLLNKENRVKLGQELYRICKDGAVCSVVIGDGTKDFAKSLTSFRWAVEWVDEANWKMFETCIYARDGRPGAWWNQRFRVDHEYILLFFKGDRPKFFNKEPLKIASKHAGKIFHGTNRLTDGSTQKIEPTEVKPTKCRGTIWKYATSNTERNHTKMEHPATYPDKLAEDLILCFSDKNDVVLDPMCGSGTTCIMAAKNQRQYIGVEISKEYKDIADLRIKNELKSNIFE
jgi:site-specific DNA-methyltransferase (adenine-specific)